MFLVDGKGYRQIWLDALRTVIPTRLLAINEKAFQKEQIEEVTIMH